MPRTKTVANRRGGRGLHSERSIGSQNPRRKSDPPEYLEAADIETCIRYGHQAGPGASMAMLIMWRAGLRASEAIGLGLEHITWGGHPTLRVTGKGKKTREVPMHRDLAIRVEIWRDVTGDKSGPLIRTTRGDAPTRETVYRWCRAAYESARRLGDIEKKINKPNAHMFRHSAARHWIACGVPINTVSLWLGHASIQTTLDTYAAILPDQLGLMNERVT